MGTAIGFLAQFGITLVSAAAAGYALFQFLGKKWIEGKFERQLQDHRHKQDQELERLKFEITKIIDGSTHLHQHEFEVLPAAWAKLNEAYGAVCSLVSPFQEAADLNVMSPAQLKDFLERSGLREWEQSDVLASPDKNKRYGEAFFYLQYNKVNALRVEAHNYIITQGIFIEPTLKEKFSLVSKLLGEAMQSRLFIQQGLSTRQEEREPIQTAINGSAAALKEIEKMASDRLWKTNLAP